MERMKPRVLNSQYPPFAGGCNRQDTAAGQSGVIRVVCAAWAGPGIEARRLPWRGDRPVGVGGGDDGVGHVARAVHVPDGNSVRVPVAPAQIGLAVPVEVNGLKLSGDDGHGCRVLFAVPAWFETLTQQCIVADSAAVVWLLALVPTGFEVSPLEPRYHW